MSLFSVTFESSGDEGAADLETADAPPAEPEMKPAETVLSAINENEQKERFFKPTKPFSTRVSAPYRRKSRAKPVRSSVISKKRPQVKQAIQFSTSSGSSDDDMEYIGKANGLRELSSDEEVEARNEEPQAQVVKQQQEEVADAEELPAPEEEQAVEEEEKEEQAVEEEEKETHPEEEEQKEQVVEEEEKKEEAEPEQEQEQAISEDEESVQIDVTESSEDVDMSKQFFELPDHVVFRGVRNPKVVEEMNAKLERLPNHKKPKNMIPYKMVKKWSLSLKGKVNELVLYQGDRPILQTKVKISKSTDCVLVSKVEGDLEFKGGKYECAILTGSNFTTYSVRLGTQFGPEIMNIKYELPMVACAPRVVTVFFRTAPEGVDRELVSKKPVMTSADTWMLDLKGRIGMRSNRNCVLIDSSKREVMSVMKTRSSLKEEVITIETVPAMSELCVFALGASSFLCNL